MMADSKDIINSRGKPIKKPQSDRARKVRAANKELMREKIKGQAHLNQIIKNVKNLENLTVEMDPVQVSRIKISNDNHFKILAKILPDVKQTDINVTGAIEHKKVTELTQQELEKIVYAEYTVLEGEDEGKPTE